MGCDIHMHTEIKVGGKWLHFSAPSVPRAYVLFALMAGVRNSWEVDPVAQQKGLPPDMSEVTKLCAEDWDSDGHSHSWLSSAEIAELEGRWYKFTGDKAKNRFDVDLEHKYFGYFLHSSWAGFYLYPVDRPAGIEDVRFVFWFDN